MSKQFRKGNYLKQTSYYLLIPYLVNYPVSAYICVPIGIGS